MEKIPLISVVIPTYNYEKYIKRAIKSVLSQTYKNIEVLVCDDGSTDNTKKNIQGLKDKKIRYFYQKNKGLSSARNLGIKKSKGKYIAFLDSDDYWLPRKLEKQIKLFKHQGNIGLVYCFHYWVNDDEKIIGKKKKYYKGNIWKNLLSGNIIIGSGSAVIVKKECFKNVGLFDQSLTSCEDWDMWIRISKKYHIYFVPELLVKITKHDGQLGQEKLKLAINRFKVMKKNAKIAYLFDKVVLLNFIKSAKILVSELLKN